MLVRQPAPASVPDELHDQRQRFGGPGGQGQPALHRVPPEPRERHVVHLDRGQTGVDEFETGVQVVLAGLLEGLGPERVEVLGLDGRAAVLVELVEGEVEQGHAGPPLKRASDDHTVRVRSDDSPGLRPGNCLDDAMTSGVDLLVKGAGLLVVDGDREIPGGWVAVTNGRVTGVGTPGSEPEASTTLSAAGRLVTPGLVNTRHHLYQNLTRSYAPAVNGTLFDWRTTLYPLWAALDEEAAYVSAYVGMAELLMGGCTTSSDHLYVHPRPRLVDAEISAARDIGFRFHATRGSMTRSVEDGGLPPRSVTQSTDEVLADSERLIRAHHDPAPGALIRVALAPCSPFSVTKNVMTATAELAERHDVRLHTHRGPRRGHVLPGNLRLPARGVLRGLRLDERPNSACPSASAATARPPRTTPPSGWRRGTPCCSAATAAAPVR
jgi:hypothetical protein